MYYSSAETIGNRDWSADGRHGGELRGGAGYIILWDKDGFSEYVLSEQTRADASVTGGGLTAEHLARAIPRPTARSEPGKPADEPRGKPDCTLTDVASALAALDPGMGYEKWIRVGMAVHATGGGGAFDAWDRWSSRSDKYKSAADLRAHWTSFDGGKGVTPATLFGLARDAGWKRPGKAERPPDPPPHPEDHGPGGARSDSAGPGAAKPLSDASPPEPGKKLTELEAANILHERMAGRWRFDTRRNAWRRLRDGRVWVLDAEGALREAAEIIGEYKGAKGMHRRHAIGNALALVAVKIDMYSGRWDRAANICCPGGGVDCEKGEWLPGKTDADAHHTRLTPVDPDMDGTPTRWLAFLDEATGGDLELIADLRQFAGYTLTEETSAEQFYVLVGQPGTGKTTFSRTIEFVMATMRGASTYPG